MPKAYAPGIGKCKRPTMRDHRGRTWDYGEMILPDGSKGNAHLDTSWGSYFYFQVGNQWYRGLIDEFECGGSVLLFDLRKRTKRDW